MTNGPVRIKLFAFLLVSIVAFTYGATELLHVQRLVQRPDVVRIVFADPQGVYPRADVDVLGVRVGTVREVVPGPGAASTVVGELDHDAAVPADVRAEASSKSAIGEQYVQLVPLSTGGPTLTDGDTVRLERTLSPPDLAGLLGKLDALVRSLPRDDLRTVLREGAAALQDLSPELRRILEHADTLSASALRNVDDLTALIDDAQTVLDTQVELAGSTRAALSDLAGLTTRLRQLDPTFDAVFVRGVAAGIQVTGLLRDNQDALPVLLNDLVSLTNLGVDNLAGIRKSLVVFPWVLEYNSQALRYCDKVDPVTGRPDQGTCHYDKDGLPIWSAHIADVVKLRGNAPYNPCTRGYEGTERHLPNGEPADRTGPRQGPDAEPNYDAHCAAPPTDPNTPNVRGFQNIPRPSGAAGRTAPGWGTALMNPNTGTVVAPDGTAYQLTSSVTSVPTDGSADLGWLLTQNLTD